MKKILLNLLLTFIILSLIYSGMARAWQIEEHVVGKGQAVLGSGITIEKAEEIALTMAKRNAIERFGVYVKSEQLVKDYKLVEDTIITISAGIVELKPDSKEVDLVMDEGIIKVKVEAVFIINRDEFEKRLEQYLRNRDSGDINKLIDKINELERKIAEYSLDQEVSLEEVEKSLEQIKVSYKELNDAFYFPGQKLIADIQSQRIARLRKVKEYLEELKTIADPYQFFRFEIRDEIEVSVKELGKIEITIPKTTILNRSSYQRSTEILREYQEYIYEPVDLTQIDTSREHPLNDRLEDINKEALGKRKVIKAPILITFLNSTDEVVAFYRSETERYFNFYLHEESVARHFEVAYLSDFDIHLFYSLQGGSIETEQQWKGQLPEGIISQVESIQPIFSKYKIDELEGKYNYEAYGELSFIYSFPPVKLEELKLEKKDIVEVIDEQINNVENKIIELEGSYQYERIEEGSKERESAEGLFKIGYSSLSLEGKVNEDLALSYTNYQDLSQGHMISFSLFYYIELIELIFNYYYLNEYIKGYGLNASYLGRSKFIFEDLTAYFGLGGGINYFEQDSKNDEILAKINRSNEQIRNWGVNLNTKIGLELNLGDWVVFSELNAKKIFLVDWYYRESTINNSQGESVKVLEEYLPYTDFSISNPILKVGIGFKF